MTSSLSQAGLFKEIATIKAQYKEEKKLWTREEIICLTRYKIKKATNVNIAQVLTNKNLDRIEQMAFLIDHLIQKTTDYLKNESKQHHWSFVELMQLKFCLKAGYIPHEIESKKIIPARTYESISSQSFRLRNKMHKLDMIKDVVVRCKVLTFNENDSMPDNGSGNKSELNKMSFDYILNK
jgi:hypothetical protein